MSFKRPRQEEKANDLNRWSDIERFNLDVTYELICEAEEGQQRRAKKETVVGTSRTDVIDPLDELRKAGPKGSVRASPETLRTARRQG